MSRYDLFYRLAILLFLAVVVSGCEFHDDVDASVKRKAVVYLRYNYNDGGRSAKYALIPLRPGHRPFIPGYDIDTRRIPDRYRSHANLHQ